MRKEYRKKVAEILATALISACIAFLQNLVTSLMSIHGLNSDPATATAVGGAISAARVMSKFA